MLGVEEHMATLRDLRIDAGFTQMELAVKARMSMNTLSRAENGKPVSKNVFERLCDVLGANPNDVTGVEVKRTYRRA